jgi:ABC-type sugar transport system substrate-binding protein
MRKSALLLAIIFAATAPTLAAAKSSKHVKHHAKAAPVAAAPADPNSAFFRALNDMAVGLGKTYSAKGGAGGSGE